MSSDGRPRFLEPRLEIAPTAWIAPGAVVVGAVEIGAEASIWYGCVLRGDLAAIRVGPRSNIQDGTVVHVDEGYPAEIGAEVTVGHRAVVHGARLDDGCLIGMGAVVLSGARVGAGALVAAGAVVREGFEVPPATLCAGVPAKVRGELDDDTRRRIAEGVAHYVEAARIYRARRAGGGPYGGS